MKVDLVELAGKGKRYEVFTCCHIKQWFCPKPQCKKAFDCESDYEDHFEEYHLCEAAMNQKRRAIDFDKVTEEKEQLSKTNIADALKRWANSGSYFIFFLFFCCKIALIIKLKLSLSLSLLSYCLIIFSTNSQQHSCASSSPAAANSTESKH